MSNLCFLTFIISFISLIVFLTQSRFRTKKYLLGALLGIFLSFQLVGLAIPAHNKETTTTKINQTQTVKSNTDKEIEAKTEQAAKEKSEAEAKAKAE